METQSFGTQEPVKTPEQNQEAISEVFKLNPELEKIGTQEQYSEYLKTIFPESIVNNKIFQHQTKKQFNLFSNDLYSGGRLGDGHYFSDFGNNYLDVDHKPEWTKKILALNILKPKYFSGGDFMKKVYATMDDRNLNSDDEELRHKIKQEYTEKLKTEYDALIGDKNGNLNSETLVFDSSQIHILGSEQDIEKFKEFIELKNRS